MDRRRHITAVDLHRDVSSLEFTELTVEALSKIAGTLACRRRLLLDVGGCLRIVACYANS
jgi:hypothetical protein